jgi:hypothetical protein
MLCEEFWITSKLKACRGQHEREPPSAIAVFGSECTEPDERPTSAYTNRSERILQTIRDHFFAAEWNEIYDFLEFVVDAFKREKPRLAEFINHVLTREMSAYRFIDGKLVDITNEQEREMLEEALADTRFAGVTAHLERALALLADRKQPDYRNSIKESVSAVKPMARVVPGNKKATLGEALKC